MQIREKCGLCGVTGCDNAVALVAEGLHAQQHRGQEAAGIMIRTNDNLYVHKGPGLVSEVFTSIPVSWSGAGVKTAIGHVRYGTVGESGVENAQPIMVDIAGLKIGLAHNGTISNALRIRNDLQHDGSILQTNSDTEIILHLIAKAIVKCGYDFRKALEKALFPLEGAFSLLFLTHDGIIALRDPMGFRPLCYGKLSGGGYVIASESIAFSVCGAEYVREVKAGEMLFFPHDGGEPESSTFAESGKLAQCIFEHVYFSRPGSRVFGDSVYKVRLAMGAKLAEEAPVDADVVMPIPDSGTFAALGFAREQGLPLDMGFTRNHYVGRTFINPASADRAAMVMRKLQPIPEAIKNKRLCIVEDSIVRGTTSLARIRALREAGAAEIHMRVSCPPHRHGCYFGIDFPESSVLIATDRSVSEVRDLLKLDSLAYLSESGMLSCITAHRSEDYCTACFSGRYPVKSAGT